MLEAIWKRYGRYRTSPPEAGFCKLDLAMSIYSSFLIRCWLKRDGGDPSFVAEHVQSGAQFRAPELAPICQWIAATNQQVAVEPDPQPEA